MTRPMILVSVVLAGVFYIAGQYVSSQPLRAEQEVAANREITVSGFGEIESRPDVARLTLGVSTGVQKSAESAMRLLSQRFDAVLGAVKSFDIDEKDMKTTNLSVRPVYDYNEGRQTIRGYEASESIVVTIRDLGTIGDVLAKTTIEGVNQAGGISFEIDDPTSLQREAQEAAIEDARENAKELAKALDVKLGKVKTFTASSGSTTQPPVFARAELSAVSDEAFAGPPVPSGSQDVTATVQVTFELK